MEPAGAPDVCHLIRRQAEERSGAAGQGGDAATVTGSHRVLEIGEVTERGQRLVEQVVVHRYAQRRVESDDLVPRRQLGEVVENRVGMVAEAIDQFRVELRAPPLARHGDGHLGATRVVERFDVVGKVDQPDGRGDLLAPDLSRHALAVPALEGLQERRAHVVPQTEAVGEVPGGHAMRLHHLLHRPSRGR